MLGSTTRQATRILGWQLVGLAVLTLFAVVMFDGRVARSVLVGAGIGLLASSYLMFVLIKQGLRPARPATVLGLFGNWLIKTLLVLGLLMIALRSRALLPPAVLAGLAGSLVSYWLAVVTQAPGNRDKAQRD